MPQQAQFVHGAPVMEDYTAGADISAGDVVVTADTPRVAHSDIANGRLGALAGEGGVYRVKCNATIAANKKVYWDDTNNEVTETSSGNKAFGVTVEASSASDQYILVRHDPSA